MHFLAHQLLQQSTNDQPGEQNKIQLYLVSVVHAKTNSSRTGEVKNLHILCLPTIVRHCTLKRTDGHYTTGLHYVK